MRHRWVSLFSYGSVNVDDSSREWEVLKQRLPVDSKVSGVVDRKEHYGAWVNIGADYQALLEITFIEGLTPEKYRAGDWCPVGSTVTASVLRFRDDNKQVYLWQVKPESFPGWRSR